MKPQFVDFIGMDGHDGPVGANQRAHAATDTGVRGVRALLNPVINREKVSRTGFQSHRHGNGTLAVNTQFNGAHRADGGATAAQRALVFVPSNLPGEILKA
jgi:hypothetical protein